ncbi:MAG TPA: PKD domain-containing protein [Mycobacteriales bacterium]|nr:PKD domain-containing protein [Mycobacteriales bacterium]
MLRARAGAVVIAATAVVAAVVPAAASPAAGHGKTPCFGKAPTIFSTKSNTTLQGTSKSDVIESTGKNVTIVGKGGNDRICGLDVKKVTTGTGNAKVQVRSGAVVTGKGTNTVVQKGSTKKHIAFTGGKGVTAFTVPASELLYATVVPGVLGDTLNGQPLTLGLPTGGPRATLLAEDNDGHYVGSPAIARESPYLGSAAKYPGGDQSYSIGYDPGTGTDVEARGSLGFYTYGVAAPAGTAIAGWSLDLGDGSPLKTGHGAPPPYFYFPVHGVGVHVVRLTVVDTLGRTATSTATIAQAGYGDVTIAPVVPSSGPTTLNLTYAPGAGAAAASYALDYGDGSAPLTGNGAPPASVMHQYPYGDYEARLWVYDDHGDLESDSEWLTYAPASTPFHLTATPVTTPQEVGNIVRVGAAASSALPARSTVTLQLYDPYSAFVSVDWGDGTVYKHYYAHENTISHQYDRPGTFTAKVTAVDTPTVASVSVPITVVPVPVLVSLNAPTVVPQGPVTITTHTTRMPAGDTWQLFYGDHSAPVTGSGPLPAHFTHTFNASPSDEYGYEGGQQYASLRVWNAAGHEVGSAYIDLSITGPQPTVTFVGFGQGESEGYQGWSPIVAGGTGYAAAALQPSAGHTLKKATISFGDGSAPLTVTDIGSGELPASETGHTYANPGDYAVTVTVTDSSGRHATGSAVVSVAGRASAALPATESSPTHAFTLTGIAAAAGANDAVLGYSVAWDDGTYTSGVGAPPASLAHTYTSASTYNPSISIVTTHYLYAYATTTATVS